MNRNRRAAFSTQKSRPWSLSQDQLTSTKKSMPKYRLRAARPPRAMSRTDWKDRQPGGPSHLSSIRRIHRPPKELVHMLFAQPLVAPPIHAQSSRAFVCVQFSFSLCNTPGPDVDVPQKLNQRENYSFIQSVGAPKAVVSIVSRVMTEESDIAQQHIKTLPLSMSN